MEGETVSIEEAGPDAGAGKREQSTISFPYLDLDAAEEVAKAVYSRSGYGSCDLDELAAEMGQVISGAFRLKTGTAKIFDVIDKDGRSSVKLTDLGKQIIEDDTRRAARVEAFMRVPLYAAVFEQYRGQKLPPMKALEREMAKLGVAAKQADKARQAFERSARQAGFFEASEDRLVRPKTELPANHRYVPPREQADHDREPPKDRRRDDAGRGGGGDDGGHHPLIQGLLITLPKVGESWAMADRQAWLKMAASIFDMIYKKGGEAAALAALDDFDELMK